MGRILKFLQDELLGMEWLATSTGRFLTMIGVDIESKLGGSIHFFVYDTIKIMLLLFSLISIFGYIDTYIPPEKTRAVLNKLSGLWANVVAALFGTVTSFCSCSSIPIFIGFTNAGLPVGVTFSFLISSPMVDIASCVLLASVFGWKVAAVYIVTGLIIAIVGGWIIGALHMENEVEEFVRKKAKSTEVQTMNQTQMDRIKIGLGEAFNTIKNIWIFIIIGVGVGAFMMSITTLSLPSLIMLRKIVKGKLFFAFLAICLVGIMIVGYTFNIIQNILLI